jgi:hypothetical protein
MAHSGPRIEEVRRIDEPAALRAGKGPSRREGTSYVFVVGRGVFAGGGRVVDCRGADDGNAAR